MKNQFRLIFSSCLGTSITLRAYYSVMTFFQFNDDHDLLLSLFLILGGWSIYAHYRRTLDKDGKYTPTDGEYSTIVIASVIGVGSKLFADGIINFSVPIFLVIGRLSGWLDTKSPKDIIDELRTQHDRVKESTMLLLVGMVIVSTVLYYNDLDIPSNAVQVIASAIYGVFILFPYYWIKRWFMNRKNGQIKA